jgi:putative transposase
MPNYRRLHLPGATYFFTVALQNRRSSLLTEQIDLLRRSVASVRQDIPFQIDAWVVLPEHMHCLWTLPDGDSDFPVRWHLIKRRFSGAFNQRGKIWQRGYWEHAIRDDADFAAHVDYIHFNPIKHGYVGEPSDWPHSTFRAAVARGWYPADWAGDFIPPTTTGEP